MPFNRSPAEHILRIAPKWLTLKEAAAYLGIGTKALTVRCKARKITFNRMGGRGRTGKGEYKFQMRWLDDYINQTTVSAIASSIRRRVVRRSLVGTTIFIDPSKCGNPFE